MSYSPAPLALDQAKPSVWNVEGAFVAPEWQWVWNDAGFIVPLWEGNGAVRDLSSRRLSDTNSGTWQPTSRGVGYDITSTSQHLWWEPYSTNYQLGGDAEFTIWVTVDVTSLSGNFPSLISHRTSFSDGIWEVYEDNRTGGNDGIRFSFRAGGTLHTVEWGPSEWPGNGLHTFVVTRRAGGVYELWVDGDSRGTQTNTNNLQAAPQRLVVGGLQADDADNKVNGTYLSAGLIRVAATDQQAKQLTYDPFGPFRPNWDYVTAAEGTGIDLDHHDASATFPTPTVAAVSIDLDLLDASASFHSPTVAATSIDLAHLSAAPTFHTPTVGATTVDLDHLDASPAFHALTVAEPGDTDLRVLQVGMTNVW